MRVTLLALIIVVIGCGGAVTDGQICTQEARAGITVDVRDSATNAMVGRGARIVARDGAVADTSKETVASDGPFGLAYERAGTYTVTVEKSGYRTWSQAGVQVTPGQCHVNGVALVARLQR